MSVPRSEREIALQLYTLRNQLATSPEAALDTVVEAGYTAVELFRPVESAPIIGGLLERRGIRVPSVHALLVGREAAPIFDTASALGAGTVIDPLVEPTAWTTRDGVLRTADALNALADEAAAWNLRVGYHNHDVELSARIDGTPALLVLAEALDADVVLEVDVYWAAVGGADVVALLTELGDRVRLLHLKDGPATATRTIDPALRAQVPFGAGVLDAPAVLAAAPHASTLVVEFDEFDGDLPQAIADARNRVQALLGGAR